MNGGYTKDLASHSEFRTYTFDLKPARIVKRKLQDVDEWFDARGKNPVDGPIYVKLKKVVVEWYIKFEDDGDYFFYFNDNIIADVKDDISNDIIRILNRFCGKFNCELEGNFMMFTNEGEWIFKAPHFDKEEPNYFDIKRRKINNLKKYFYINGDSPSYLYYAYCKGEIEGLPKVVIKWKPGPLGEKEFFRILDTLEFEKLKADVIDTVEYF